MLQLGEAMGDPSKNGNMAEIEAAVRAIARHESAFTEAPKSSATKSADRAMAAENRKIEKASIGDAEAEAAGDKITEVAAEKIRKEADAKTKAAEAQRNELLRQASIEHMRLTFRKK